MRHALRLLFLLFLAGCSALAAEGVPDDVPPDDALRVLFVGNSLTYTHDLPAVVAALAEAAGDRPLHHRMLAFPNASLEDHWHLGQAANALEAETWDLVVLQQGPSSLPESRAHLVQWTGRWAEAIRAAGAEPVVYMVWPSASRAGAFEAVDAAYAGAAEATAARLAPAGRAWQRLWAQDPDAALYGPDGFHPSRKGTLLAALSVYHALYHSLPETLSAEVPVGGERLRLTAAEARQLLDAAAAAQEVIE